MKKLKLGIASLIVLLALTGCNEAKPGNDNQQQSNPEAEKNVNGMEIDPQYLTGFTVERIKNSKITMPPFTLSFNGTVEKTINSNTVSNLQMYDFITYKATDFSPFKTAVQKRYTGIRLLDVLNYVGTGEFSEIILLDEENGEITLPASKINENVFLAFYEDGVRVGEGKVDFVIPEFVNIFWGKGLKSITIKK